VSARPTDSNRDDMLAEVRRVWIDGYLKHSLDNLVRIELGLEETPDAVSRPWDLIVQPPNQTPRPLPPGQAMGTVFDELGQALLILGAPGAGKTTLLLELARDLLDRAVQVTAHPIPVVFHLSSWAVLQRPLADWLVDELVSERYGVSRKLAQAWTDAEQVLPLLDGLDEVAPEHRVACVEAINAFRRQHARVPLAVCSRMADYEGLPERVALSGAVVIQPLSRTQVSSYLRQAGKALAGVRMVLRDDETLWELLETPLMLSIVALAYQGRSAAEVRAAGSLEQRRTHLFKNYTQRMFERRCKVTGYTPEQTLHWLTWLARSLMHQGLSIFYVEWMQPDSRVQRWIMATIPFVFAVLAVGLPYGLLGLPKLGLADLLHDLLPELNYRSAVGLAGMLLSGLVAGLAVGLGPRLAFGLGPRLAFGLAVGLLAGPAFGLPYGLLLGLDQDLAFGETLEEAFGLVYNLAVLLALMLKSMWISMQASMLIFGSVGLVVGLISGLLFALGIRLDRIKPIEQRRWSWRKARDGFRDGLAAWLVFTLIARVIVGLLLGVPSAFERPVGKLVYWLVIMLLFGLVGLGIRQRRWSWRKARDSFRDGLVVVLLMQVFALVVMLIYQPGFYLDESPNAGSELKWPVTELASKLVIGLGIVTNRLIGQLLIQLIDLIVTLLIAGLIGGLIRGLTTHQIVTRTMPNEGIRRSLQNAWISFLTGLLFGSLFMLIIERIGMLDSVLGPDTASAEDNDDLFWTLFDRVALVLSIGLLFGELFALWNGGFAYLKHYVLRFLLWRNNYAPWSYIRFLDHAVERVFLRKVGGGYIFTHRLLMEHFAALQLTDQARQIKAE
jgi:hypothetical protein